MPYAPTLIYEPGRRGEMYQSITAMTYYRAKSFEELRLEHYGLASSDPFGAPGPSSQWGSVARDEELPVADFSIGTTSAPNSERTRGAAGHRSHPGGTPGAGLCGILENGNLKAKRALAAARQNDRLDSVIHETQAGLWGMLDRTAADDEAGAPEEKSDIPQPEPKTPLFIACEAGNVDAARLLLDKGAEVDRAMEDTFAQLGVALGQIRSSPPPASGCVRGGGGGLCAAEDAAQCRLLGLTASDIELRDTYHGDQHPPRNPHNMLCLDGCSFGTFENHKVPKVVAVHPLPVAGAMAERWAARARGKFQSWAWHGTSSKCSDGKCAHRDCNLCSIVRNGFLVERCDGENEACRRLGNVTFLAFAAAHAAVFADQTEHVTGVEGRRVVILSRVVTGIDLNAVGGHEVRGICIRKDGTNAWDAAEWGEILAHRSAEGCWYGGQIPSGPGCNVMLSWRNENILPLYAVEVEAVEPFLTRMQLENDQPKTSMVENTQYYPY